MKEEMESKTEEWEFYLQYLSPLRRWNFLNQAKSTQSLNNNLERYLNTGHMKPLKVGGVIKHSLKLNKHCKGFSFFQTEVWC